MHLVHEVMKQVCSMLGKLGVSDKQNSCVLLMWLAARVAGSVKHQQLRGVAGM